MEHFHNYRIPIHTSPCKCSQMHPSQWVQIGSEAPLWCTELVTLQDLDKTITLIDKRHRAKRWSLPYLSTVESSRKFKTHACQFYATYLYACFNISSAYIVSQHHIAGHILYTYHTIPQVCLQHKILRSNAQYIQVATQTPHIGITISLLFPSYNVQMQSRPNCDSS